MSTPSLKEMLEIWHTVTKADDPFLDTLTTEGLLADLLRDGKSIGQSVGSAMRRRRIIIGITWARSKPSARCWDIRTCRSMWARLNNKRRIERNEN